jgi:hypothetical protein
MALGVEIEHVPLLVPRPGIDNGAEEGVGQVPKVGGSVGRRWGCRIFGKMGRGGGGVDARHFTPMIWLQMEKKMDEWICRRI